MSDRPYTDDDLRAEAAHQHYNATTDPDFVGVGEQMDDETWRSLSEDDFDAAQRSIHDLINGAADTSEWAVNLGSFGLTETTSMGWYCTGSGWDVAVQLAHRPQIRDDIRGELESAVQRAVERVLADHGLTPRGLDTTT